MKKSVAFIVVGMAASASMADGVDLRFKETGAGSNVKIQYGSTSQNVFSGQLLHEFSNGTGIMADIQGDFFTYCTDITQYVNRNGTRYEVTPLTQIPNAPGVTPMSFEQAQAIRNLFAGADGAQFGESVSNDLAAAFQLMVWEIVWDFGPGESPVDLDLSTGSFRASKTNGSSLSSGVLSQFSTLRTYVGQVSGVGGLVGLSSGSAQDQLFVVPGPGSGVLAGMGLLLATRRRRNRA